MGPPGGLDTAAREYASLIADPCNAKLTGTIWPGSHGAFVSRFETDFMIGTSVSTTATTVIYVPGTNSTYVPGIGGTLDNTDFLLSSGTAAQSPGVSFLSSNAGTIRAVASCIQVSFVGTELNRSGVVSGGVMNTGSITKYLDTASGGGNSNVQVGQLRSLTQHVERMPTDMMEITWFPASGDINPFQYAAVSNTAASNVNDAADKNALVITASGFPVSTGIRVRIVTVVEWTPRVAAGFVATVEHPKSSNSLNDVLRALPASKGTNWFINAYKKLQPYAKFAGSAISYAAKRFGPALMAL